jgi:hypothetical protein
MNNKKSVIVYDSMFVWGYLQLTMTMIDRYDL